MAATGFTPVYLYASGTAGHIPLAANLTNTTNGSEIALNYADGNLFFKNATNSVITTPLLQSSGSQNGWLSSTDWTTFNNKQAALVSGTNIKTVNGTSLLGSGDVGTIGVGYGGTGLTSVASGLIPFGSSASALSSNGGLSFSSGYLQISGNNSSVDALQLTGYNGFGHAVALTSATSTASDFIFGTQTNIPIKVYANGGQVAEIFASGGVSIGNTTDPGATNLSVTGTVSNSGETVNGTLWMKDASQIQIGYNAYRASIYNNGAGPLILTPTSGYGITLNSSAVANGDFSPYSCYPQSDNAYTCGTSAKRWSVVYAATGTINTSDERTKDDITTNLAPELKAWAKVEYCKFKYKDAIQRKGDGARWHIGLIAQKVKEAFESEGLNAFDYGLLCYDEWEDEYEIQIDEEGNETGRTLITKAGNLYGIRYEEALAMECAYLRSMLNK